MLYRVQVADRMFQILDLLGANKAEMGSSEIAARLNLHKSTIHRLLVALERNRFVEKNPLTAKYHLGWHVFELGMMAVSRLDFLSVARPYLEALVKKTRETAHMGILSSGELLSILSVEADRSLRLPATVGRRSPLYCTSQGKAILAFSADEMVGQYVRSTHFKAFTPNTITKISRFREELELIRRRGYSIDNEELEPDLRCIGAPVFDHKGSVIAGVSIAGPTYRVGAGQLPKLAEAMITTSRELSSALGLPVGEGTSTARRTRRAAGW
jgi:DNA-binding IclR family transcriptional regulator